MKIAVLGGGITGCTTARLLAAAGHELCLFEAAPRLGGLCASSTIDGFVSDHAGGHILFSKDKQVLDFMLGALGPGNYHTTKRDTRIWLRDRFVRYPFENGLCDLHEADKFRCLRDYILAWHERRNGAAVPTNFRDWCTWRFGEGICALFMHPYNRKIWNVPLEELGTAWVEGRVPDAPMEDVLQSALGQHTAGYVHQAVFHYPLTGGFESVVHAIAAGIPAGVVRLNTPVTSVERRAGGYAVNGERFDEVVSTLPLATLGRMLEGLPAAVRTAFGALDHVSLRTVFLALDKSDAPPHSWLYFPDPHDGPQNRLTWLSNYSPRNAPPGKSSVMAEVTWYRERPGTEAETTEAVVAGLTRGGFFQRDQVLFSRCFDVDHAYILYRSGLEEHLESARRWCAEQGLHVVGRFGNYSYFNSDMCVRAAMDLAADFAKRS